MIGLDNLDAYFSPSLRKLFDAQAVGIWILNSRGDVLYVNPSGMQAVGVDALRELAGKNTVRMTDFGYSTSDNMEKVLETRQPTYASDVLTRTGRRADILSYPLLDADGNIVCIICFNVFKGLLQFSQSVLLAQHFAEHAAMAAQEPEHFIVESDEMKAILKSLSRVADKDATVLLVGESGVGKDGVARLIHRLSSRKEGPYVPINCSAIPENLVESELFGYERGAFTGAMASRMGLLEMANGGTVFLDEIGDLPLFTQVKLLRTLQNRSIMRLGGKKPIELNVRFITATHQHLEELVAASRFREDFYYRINVIKIEIPPLRERKKDIMPLCRYFASKFEEKYGEKKYFSRISQRMLMDYAWPGNVRELENAVEQALTLCPYSIVSPDYLPVRLRQNHGAPLQDALPTLQEAVAECERNLIHEVLRFCDSSRKAARVLGVDQKTVLRKMKRYGLGRGEKE